jgi:hypothetical protein
VSLNITGAGFNPKEEMSPEQDSLIVYKVHAGLNFDLRQIGYVFNSTTSSGKGK